MKKVYWLEDGTERVYAKIAYIIIISRFSELFGHIATHGFTQGPGQSLAYGKMWAGIGALADLPIVGLIYANVGFIFAFIIGVSLACYFISRGKNANKKASIENEYLVGILPTTFFYIWFFGRKLPQLGPERMIAILGCCTGATANGLLLLRILDPDYTTGVSMELAFFNIAILFTAAIPVLLMAPNVPNMAFMSIIGFYGLYTLF
jgi:Na+/glutamate symporter